MRIEVMLIAKGSSADTTSVSTMIDLDTQKPGWELGLVQAVTDQASAGAERLREHLAMDEVPTTFEPAIRECAPERFVPLAELVPTATPTRRGF